MNGLWERAVGKNLGVILVYKSHYAVDGSLNLFVKVFLLETYPK